MSKVPRSSEDSLWVYGFVFSGFLRRYNGGSDFSGSGVGIEGLIRGISSQNPGGRCLRSS
ncbi:MAG: hypothetical protein GYA69_02025 [Candidatus Moranbacteria bacterium]|nr:hypothetical protein [Candidatus Moranbacteria bacterium]